MCSAYVKPCTMHTRARTNWTVIGLMMVQCALIGWEARRVLFATKSYCQIASIGQIFPLTALSTGHFIASIYASRPLCLSIKFIIIQHEVDALPNHRQLKHVRKKKKKKIHLNYGTMRQLIRIVAANRIQNIRRSFSSRSRTECQRNWNFHRNGQFLFREPNWFVGGVRVSEMWLRSLGLQVGTFGWYVMRTKLKPIK